MICIPKLALEIRDILLLALLLSPRLDDTIFYHPNCTIYTNSREKIQIHKYVNPHMVTNSFLKRGLPIWEFFRFPARSDMGIPVWLRRSPYGKDYHMGIFTQIPTWSRTLWMEQVSDWTVPI